MNDEQLIFVIGPGRCLTSAVTGVLEQMGVWVGSDPRRKGHPTINPKGFFEHRTFKRIVQQIYAQQGMICNTTEGWQIPQRPHHNSLLRYQIENAMKSDGYHGGPAALKNVQVAAILDVFKPEFPNSIYLFVKRNPEEVIRSYLDKYKLQDIEVSEVKVSDWVRNANRVCEQYATDVVYAEDVITGKTDVLKQVVEKVGLVWDQSKADAFIDPSFYHGKV